VEIFDILGPRYHPCEPIGVKFCVAKETHAPLGCAKFQWISAMSHPCGTKMLIFGLWVNLIPAVCRFAPSCQ